MTHEEIMTQLELEHQEKMAQIEAKHQEVDLIMEKINNEVAEAQSIEDLPKAEDLASAFKQIMAIMKETKK